MITTDIIWNSMINQIEDPAIDNIWNSKINQIEDPEIKQKTSKRYKELKLSHLFLNKWGTDGFFKEEKITLKNRASLLLEAIVNAKFIKGYLSENFQFKSAPNGLGIIAVSENADPNELSSVD